MSNQEPTKKEGHIPGIEPLPHSPTTEGKGDTPQGVEPVAKEGSEPEKLAESYKKEEQERTRIKKELFIEYWVKTLGSVQMTCDKVGISRVTYYDWRDTDPVFAMNLRKAIAAHRENVVELLNKEMLKGDSASIRYWLDRVHPLFKPKQKIEGIVPGVKTADEELKDYEWSDDNNTEYQEETEDEQSDVHSDAVSDQGQEKQNSAVQTEQGAKVLLEKKDTPKPDIKSATKGNQ